MALAVTQEHDGQEHDDDENAHPRYDENAKIVNYQAHIEEDGSYEAK